MMKKIAALLILIFFASACQHKDLYFGDHHQLVDVNIHWDEEVNPPNKGMRVEFFTQSASSPEVGTEDFPSPHGGKLRMLPESEYDAICYDFLGSEINKIRNNRDCEEIQVYTNGYNRASYSRAFPDEHLATQPDLFYMDKVTGFKVQPPWRIDFYPSNRVETYTFEIRHVRGARFISSLAGACSGLSVSYYLGQECIVGDGGTITFGANRDDENNRIVGSFRTFGHCGDALPNMFTIEIRYPSGDPDNGYMMKTWDVTDQMRDGYHIILEWNITVIPSGGDSSGFDVSVQPWDELWIPLEL